MRDRLIDYLQTLNIIIANSTDYFLLYGHINKVKVKNGSMFRLFTENGLPTLRLSLEGLNIPVPNDTNSRAINAYETLCTITDEFSVLSGMSMEDWEELAAYLQDSKARILYPDLQRSSDTAEGERAVKLLLDYPWSIGLILLEIMPYYRPREKPINPSGT